MTETIDVVVNGERRPVARDATLLELLRSLALDPRAVVVEHNRRIVRRPALGDVRGGGRRDRAGALRGRRVSA